MIDIRSVALDLGGQPILRDISLSIDGPGVTALIGPNGAGKSSLLRLVGRLEPLQTGSIHVCGLPVDRTSGQRLARSMAVLSQETPVASRLTVRELVGYGRFPHNHGRLTSADRAMVEAMLTRFELFDLADRFLETLSGGQRQRALIAMTVCQDTPVILLDEPLNSLDMQHARHLMRTLRRLADEEHRSILVVIHDVNHAAAHADRIVAMRQGRIVADGPPAKTLTAPVLQAIYGFPTQVEMIDGIPFVLHHR
ncbi:ABC transporter ATP-binding protein [Aurantimonas endophytica]|uniref:Iron complex transport system ATP-binding protein n=1 Tax=Aurantimonas endophytica TaxID=1522175 RepID=A0A7W6H9N6_9HYPH|nr:ATP-binding cassette domain-containing protein [Aurantimonas endophytica]MBB4001210.1 iron complex transport system ATP-binding protein [Aurantimonas endophytica]MCO6403140.1 ATP-binding cassette domain-containing protein [Aurantimonas endophytica]